MMSLIKIILPLFTPIQWAATVAGVVAIAILAVWLYEKGQRR